MMADKKVLYHGTGKTIGEFNRHTYFATDPKISDRYATYRKGEAPQMYRVEAKLKNPAYMDDFRKAKQELGKDAINEDVFSHLESKGFDHFSPYGKNSKEIVIFDPNKSTLPKFAEGGEVEGYIPHDDPRRAANLAAWHEGSHPATKNDNGHPRVYYHGSNQKLDVIRPGMRDPGAWFTTNKQNAANYARGHDSYLHEVYLKSKNPMVVPFDYDENGGLHAYHDGKKLPFSDNVSIVKHAQKLGYDGVHFPYGNFSEDDNTFVVFDPHQIKSVDNDGNFRTDKEEINKRNGGEVDDGITAYHGSPHDFDQFDISKIGTGEGAQAYGHGLYFADTEPAAKVYAENASDKYAPDSIANRMLKGWSDRDTAIAKQKERIGRLEQSHKEDFILPHRKALEILESGKTPKIGHMYEVHINAHPDDFLDWDYDLNHDNNAVAGDMLPGVRHYDRVMSKFKKPPTGQEFYHGLAEIAGSDAAAAKLLHEAGIKGVQYSASGTPGANKSSRNYVVFDHDLVTTKRKYADGGSVAA